MNRRKGAAVLLAAVMALVSGFSGSYAQTEEEPFTDIGGHWAESVIKDAASLGIVGGYPDGTFLPDHLIKREEFFKLLTNILTETPDTSGTKIPFTDVTANEWYVPTVKIAVAAGITSGYQDGTFGVGLMISRQEAAKVAGSVIPALGVEEKKGAETALDKGKIAGWAYDYVDLMFKKGYMQGDTEGNFRPTMALTRAEAATILLNIKKNESVISGNADKLSATNCLKAHYGQKGVFLKGNGTKSNLYEIATEEQLNHLRLHLSENAYYIITKNIAITQDYAVTPPAVTSGEADWTAGNFVPIGSKAAPFKGTVFGNGYTISGLNIYGRNSGGSSKAGASYAGLFGYLAPGSTVTDLIIDASVISGNQYTGAIAGFNAGMVRNSQLGKKGIINGNADTGGLVGFSTQPLSSLRNRGSVTGSGENTGGIVGSISASGTALLYSQNEGTVTGTDRVGGIAGRFESSDGTAATAQECVNAGVVTGSGVVGGIIGRIDSVKAVVTKSKNSGTVSGNGAGGIVGYNQGTISFSYNSGSVKADMDGGGIAAYQENGDGRITRSYNEGTVLAENFAGGITGENGAKIDNSYHSGKVTGADSVGGISGKNSGTITNVYCSGIVSGDNSAGSLVGKNSGLLNNSFWLNSSGKAAVGLSDNADGQQSVSKVSWEELSGQVKIKTVNGYEMLIDVMNANGATDKNGIDNTETGPVWEYLYTVVEPAPSSATSVISGGGIVPLVENPAADRKGNTIKATDLNTKYLYPSIVN